LDVFFHNSKPRIRFEVADGRDAGRDAEFDKIR
jgi:hypothetical protein